MGQHHPNDDRPRNGTPLEGEYYPDQQAPRQHFPHGYSQQSRGPVCSHGFSIFRGKHPNGDACEDPRAAEVEAAHDLGTPVSGFHQAGYPGQEPFAYPLQTPPAKKKMSKWVWALIIFVVVFALCAIGSTAVLGFGAKAITDEVEATKSDVTLVAGSCREGTLGWEAKVKIVNSGTTKRSYWVQVNLMNGQTRLGEAHAIVNDLGPGQSVTETATGSGDLVKGATCVIGDVN